ncbi:MAG: DUF2155 domain-containing protein [Mangrovicoccus sp.]
MISRWCLALILALFPLTSAAESVATAQHAVLRGLDRLSGELEEFELEMGQPYSIGELVVTVVQCRYPVDNPAGDAYGLVVIEDNRVNEPVFTGWMVASSPALNALDHMRYDVWLLRCKTS